MCTGNFLVTVSYSFTKHYVATKALRHTLHETLQSVSASKIIFTSISEEFLSCIPSLQTIPKYSFRKFELEAFP